MGRALVCSIGLHDRCDGNAPNGPAGEGNPCVCSCHETRDSVPSGVDCSSKQVYNQDMKTTTRTAADKALAAGIAIDRNVKAKADRALEAIDSLITHQLIEHEDFAEVTDLDTGRAFMLQHLSVLLDPGVGNVTVSAALWVAVGIEHDRIRGHYAYGPGERAKAPTQFVTSRELILETLDMIVAAAQSRHLRSVPDDPFEGLAF